LTDESITDKKLSRRQFVGAAAAGAAALGAVAGATTLMPKVAVAPSTAGVKAGDAAGEVKAAAPVAVNAQPSGIPSSWDYTADVVILGTGFGGLASAISAYDAGASVLVLEKMSQTLEGGDSKVAMNGIWAPTNPTTLTPNVLAGAIYLKSVACGFVEDDEIFTVQSQGYVDNLAYIKALGGNLGTYTSVASYSAAADAQYYHTFNIALPGAPVQSNGYPIGSAGDGALWTLYRENAASRNIQVMYETPATDLIQNPNTGEIIGVYATNNGSTGNGSTLAIQAKKGVIIATGSTDFALDMQLQYWGVSPIYGTGCPGDTGDGIKMAQKVGADLWHMVSVSGSVGYSAFVIPGTDPLVSSTVSVSAPGIKVNKMGNRFNMNTAVNGPLGGFANELNVSLAFDTTTLDWDSVPCWAIFDDTQRKKAPIMATPQVASPAPGVNGKYTWFVWHSGYTWSADNSAEIASGWITSAPDLGTLATAIAADPDNKSKMTSAALEATVAAWNTDVTNDIDAQFFTSPASLTSTGPISTPPFYAMKLWPGLSDPVPGPRRNKYCQVVDPSLRPIPRLYSAGAMGAFIGWMQGYGSHIGECLWTGRTAGNNAAALAPWTS
jgi:hypothetical protein